MKTALSIAGSDCSGGAGIQADLKTMSANGVYGMTVVTALTAQSTVGIRGIYEVEPDFLGLQLDCIFQDIFPDAVKVGMLSSERTVRVVANKLKEYHARNLVLDPVMMSSSKTRLISEEGENLMKEELFPIATLLTPNIPEAEALTKVLISNSSDMEKAARALYQAYGSPVLLKGGHGSETANDLLFDGKNSEWFYARRIPNNNTHGTGCTLSSAIASNLAKGYSLSKSVVLAKSYITKALSAMLELGKGSGPLQHFCNWRED